VRNPERPAALRLLLLVYFVLGVVGVNVLGLWMFIRFAADPKAIAPWFALAWVCLFPVIASFVFMLSSIFAFKYDYCIFGRYRRTAWPDETPLLEHSHSHGRIGFFSATVPFFTWKVFPSGLGFSVWLVGKGFIPNDRMIRVEKGIFFQRLVHDSDEIRSPVRFAHDDMYACLRKRVEYG